MLHALHLPFVGTRLASRTNKRTIRVELRGIMLLPMIMRFMKMTTVKRGTVRKVQSKTDTAFLVDGRC